MDTIQKGTVTELCCALDFTKLGYIISQPLSPCRYDFIVDTGNNFIKIQCKSSHPIDTLETAIKFECRSTRNVKQGDYSQHRRYLADEIDYFYTSYKGQGYLIPLAECSTSKILRFTSTSNNKNISWAKNYEIEKILSEVSK